MLKGRVTVRKLSNYGLESKTKLKVLKIPLYMNIQVFLYPGDRHGKYASFLFFKSDF